MTEQVISRDDECCLSNRVGMTFMTEQVIRYTSPFMFDHTFFCLASLRHATSLHVSTLEYLCRDFHNACYGSEPSSGCQDTVRLCIGMAVGIFLVYVGSPLSFSMWRKPGLPSGKWRMPATLFGTSRRLMHRVRPGISELAPLVNEVKPPRSCEGQEGEKTHREEGWG